MASLSASQVAIEEARERVREAVTTLDNAIAHAVGVGVVVSLELTTVVVAKRKGLPHVKVKFLKQEEMW